MTYFYRGNGINFNLQFVEYAFYRPFDEDMRSKHLVAKNNKI
jgi:hypothetical protein